MDPNKEIRSDGRSSNQESQIAPPFTPAERDGSGGGRSDKVERGRGGRGGQNGGNNRKRGGKGEGGEGNREFLVSKALSWILRHGAVKEGLELDGDGFARCDQLLQWHKLKSLKVTLPEIQQTVSTNAKQRFTLKPNPTLPLSPTSPSAWLIRANQGHSITLSSSSLLTPITLSSLNSNSNNSDIPSTVIHGTYYSTLALILESGGLSRMGRNHIHFSVGLPEDKQGVISGMRENAEVLIYVDIRKCLDAEGQTTAESQDQNQNENNDNSSTEGISKPPSPILWWRSSNNVILTEGDSNGILPTKYWSKVIGRKGDLGVLWEDGKVVKEVPVELRGRGVPGGKGVRGGKGDRVGRGGRGGRGVRWEGKGRGKEEVLDDGVRGDGSAAEVNT